MRRGDLVTIALSGDFGKPRPALVIQADYFDLHPSVTVLPVTSDLREAPLFRITVMPSAENGLDKPSQIMVDKAMTVAREKVDVIRSSRSENHAGNRTLPGGVYRHSPLIKDPATARPSMNFPG